MSKADGLDDVIFTSKELREQEKNPGEITPVDKDTRKALLSVGIQALKDAERAAEERGKPPQRPTNEKTRPLREAIKEIQDSDVN
ncbi:MAG: hypothetical protein ABIH35_02110 [Patescibacteria group bacterium]